MFLEVAHPLLEFAEHQVAATITFPSIWVSHKHPIRTDARVPMVRSVAFKLDITLEKQRLAATVDEPKVFDPISPPVRVRRIRNPHDLPTFNSTEVSVGLEAITQLVLFLLQKVFVSISEQDHSVDNSPIPWIPVFLGRVVQAPLGCFHTIEERLIVKAGLALWKTGIKVFITTR